MPELPETDPKRLDEELASFTDRVLSEKQVDSAEPASPDSELRRLEQTVLRLKSAFGPPEQPPAAAAERIRQHLAREWQQSAPIPSSTLPEDDEGRSSWQSWMRRHFGWDTPSRRRRTLTLVFSSLAVVTLLAALVFSPAASVSQPAAAGRIPILVVFLFFAAAAVAAFFSGKRHK